MNCPKCGCPALEMGADFVCTKCQVRILSSPQLEHSAGFYRDLLQRAEADVDALKLRVKVLEKALEEARAAVSMNPNICKAVEDSLEHYRDKIAGPHTRALFWAASKLLEASKRG